MRTLCVFIIALFFIPFAYAGETFYTSLESKASVEAEGGEVIGGKFVPGQEGNGFMSELGPDVIHFPYEDKFGDFSEGTIEAWVTLGWDIDDFTTVMGKEEMFILWSYNAAGTDAIGVEIGGCCGRPSWPIVQMRLKSAGTWYGAASEELDWKEGEIHHVAGTFGPDGLKIYLDAELAGTDDFVGGTNAPIERFSINNNESDPATFPSMNVVDEMRMYDEQLTPDGFKGLAVSPEGTATTTWGTIKKGIDR